MYNYSLRKAGGALIITNADGSTIEHDTATCCHCNGVWVVKPGSGTVRGWCTMCNDRHCGSEKCMTCVPFEKKLDMFEKGLIREL
jgi:hypothetical protein